jgi:hypothetical protein
MSAQYSLESAVVYLQTYRPQYGLETLREQLLRSGYPATAVAQAIDRVYQSSPLNYYNPPARTTVRRDGFSMGGCISSFLTTVVIAVTAG